MITHVRIDERLAHGQVCVRWVASTHSTNLIVLDTPTAKDPFLRKVVTGVAPQGVNIEVCAEEDIPQIVSRYNGTPDTAVMIVTKYPHYIVKMVEAGASDIKSITVGNMGSARGRVRVTQYALCSSDEKKQFLGLDAVGISLETRQLPDDRPQDFKQALLKAKC